MIFFEVQGKREAKRMQPPWSFGLLATVVLVTVSLAGAQQQNQMYRLGYLSNGVGRGAREEIIQQGLRDLGYIEGHNLVIAWRFGKGNTEQLPALAAELVRLKLDVIITSGTPPTRALQAATATIPIVIASAGDLVGRGLVASLAHPGGNITGSTSLSPALSSKRLALLKEAVPQAARAAFLYQPYEEDELREIQSAASAVGVQIQGLAIHQASQFESAYAAMTKERADMLIISRNAFTNVRRRQLIDLAVTHRLPTMCDGIEWMNDGCIMSYAPDRTEGYRRTAVYVDKILKGIKPADLPVGQPTRFEFIINVKAAKQLGLTIPPSVMYQADKLIQ
jgi:putative tryptophan/tyrosine transport system substrate-binding protein